jgi:hypothetical protein
MFVECIACIRPSRIRAGGQNIRMSNDCNNVGCMSSTCAFRVVRTIVRKKLREILNGPTLNVNVLQETGYLESSQRALHIRRLVKCVRMNQALDVVFIAYTTSELGISKTDLKQVSIAAGVVPQSSCSFNPTAPAKT